MSGTARNVFLRVFVDGTQVANAIAATVVHGFTQRVASAEVHLPVKPSWAQKWSRVQIEMGAPAVGSTDPIFVQRFDGYLIRFSFDLETHDQVMICRGKLVLAAVYQNPLATGTDLTNGGVGQTDEQMVSQILTTCGVTDLDIRGTSTVLGTVAVDQFTWDKGQSGLSMIERLDDVSLGYRTFDQVNKVVRHQIKGNPSLSSAATFTAGVDIERANNDVEYSDIKNEIIVTGYDDGTGLGAVEATVQQASPFLPPGTTYTAEPYSSPMIERALKTDPGNGFSCQDVGEWIVGERNRALVHVRLVTPRADQLMPGQTIHVVDTDRLGLPSATPNFWIQDRTISIDASGRFLQEFECIAGIGSTSPIVLPPSADFAMDVDVETVIVGGSPVLRYIVQCRDTSIAYQGSITTRTWSATAGCSPTSGSGLTFTCVTDDPTGESIILTITDTQGSTDAITKVINTTVSSQMYIRRKIQTALIVGAECFDGQTWRVQPEDTGQGVTCTTASEFWGGGTDLLYSQDDLQSAPSEVSPFAASGGSVASVWCEPDADPNLVLAGASDGNVAYSTDAGVTWTLCTRPSNSQVNRVAINRAFPSQFFALTADILWISWDKGVTWTAFQSAQAGETFRELSLSFGRSIIAMAGGRLAIEMTSGMQQTFPSVVPAVTDVVGIVPDINQDRFCFLDSQGRLFYHQNPGDMATVQGGSIPAGAAAERCAYRDGKIAEMAYFGLRTGGAWKGFNLFSASPTWLQLRAPGVDGCPAGADYQQVVPDSRTTVLPTGTPGELWISYTQGIMRRTTKGTYSRVNPAQFTTSGFVASALGFPDTVYVVSGGSLWKSTNNGSTWISLSLPTGVTTAHVTWISCADGDPATVFLSVSAGAGIPADPRNGVWRSTDGGMSWSLVAAIPDPNQGSGGTFFHAFVNPTLWTILEYQTGKSVMHQDLPGGSYEYTDIGDPLGIVNAITGIRGDNQHAIVRTGTKMLVITHGVPALGPGVGPNTGTINWIVAKSSGTTLLVASAGWVSGPVTVYRSPSYTAPSWVGVLFNDADLIFGNDHVIDYDNNTGRWWVVAGKKLWYSDDDGVTWMKEDIAPTFIGNSNANRCWVVV